MKYNHTIAFFPYKNMLENCKRWADRVVPGITRRACTLSCRISWNENAGRVYTSVQCTRWKFPRNSRLPETTRSMKAKWPCIAVKIIIACRHNNPTYPLILLVTLIIYLYIYLLQAPITRSSPLFLALIDLSKGRSGTTKEITRRILKFLFLTLGTTFCWIIRKGDHWHEVKTSWNSMSMWNTKCRSPNASSDRRQ